MNKLLKFTVPVLFLFSQVYLQTFPEELKTTIKDRIDASINTHDLKGMVVTVQLPNDLEFSYGSGIASLGVPVDPAKSFRYSSFTKFLTSIIIMQLHERDSLDIEDPIGNYIDDLPNVDMNLKIRELLQNRATIGDMFNSVIAVVQQYPDSIHNVRKALEDHVPAPINPQKYYSYNNSNFNVLGLIIESVTGNTGEEEFQKRLFDPLGLEHAKLAPVNVSSDYFNGTWYNGTDMSGVSTNALLTSLKFSGGATGTTSDMLKVLKAHLKNQYINSTQLVSMQTPSPYFHGYGKGMMIAYIDGDTLYGHGGGTIQTTRTYYSPKYDIGLSIALNMSNADAVNGLLDLIYKDLKNSAITLGTEVAEQLIPASYALSQNFPNPFNPETVIRYEIQNDSKVLLKVYNSIGQEIKLLVDGYENAGVKEVIWDGRDDAGNKVGSGIYFYYFSNEFGSLTKKMILLK